MQLGCSTILFGGHPLDTALAGISRAGYATIELCAIPGMADHLPAEGSPDDYRLIRQKIADAGLIIESVGASTNLLDPDRRARFVRLLQAAALLGAPAITTGPGGVSDDEASFRQVVAVLRDLARAAADTGVKISLKPHVRQAAYNTPTALRLMAEVDSPWVGLNYDPSHLWRAQETPEAAIPALRPYILTARIRDAVSREPGGPGPVEQQIPGQGAMNLPAIAQGLKTVPTLRSVVLEIVGARDLPAEAVQQVIERSKQALDRYFA